MTHHVVTGRDLETHTVTLDAPHGDLLARATAALASWQYDATQAEAAMIQVQGDVFLDPGGEPVVPSWWDRTAEGRGMWLVWPAGYARATGKPRRERVEDVDAVEAQRQRTIAYRDAWARRNHALQQIERAGQDLARLADKYSW